MNIFSIFPPEPKNRLDGIPPHFTGSDPDIGIMPCCDSPRISQDDDFQEHFLPGCHFFFRAAGRRNKKSAHKGNSDVFLTSSSRVAT